MEHTAPPPAGPGQAVRCRQAMPRQACLWKAVIRATTLFTDLYAKSSQVEPSRAEPSRAEPSRAEPSRAEPSRGGAGQGEGRRRHLKKHFHTIVGLHGTQEVIIHDHIGGHFLGGLLAFSCVRRCHCQKGVERDWGRVP
jgi:hypothetical protein